MVQAPAIAVKPTSPTSCHTTRQQQQQEFHDKLSPAKRAKPQQQASLQTSHMISLGERAAAHHGHHQQQQQQQTSRQMDHSPAKQPGTQHSQAQAEAPLSYRKRQRKPSHPQCSGPSSFCRPPSPDTHAQRSSSKPPTGLSPPSSDRQLRPRQHIVGRWAAKGLSHQSREKGSPEVPEGQASCPQKASKGSSSSGTKSPLKSSKILARGVAADNNQGATALPDNQLMVDGVLTEWTDTADKSILFACMIKAHGQPSLEVFQGLVKEIRESGCQVTLSQVQARFGWQHDRILAAEARKAVAAS